MKEKEKGVRDDGRGSWGEGGGVGQLWISAIFFFFNQHVSYRYSFFLSLTPRSVSLC